LKSTPVLFCFAPLSFGDAKESGSPTAKAF
jgi:hypothetical protein